MTAPRTSRIANPSAFGRLVAGVSWQGTRARGFADGGVGHARVLNAEVLWALDLLPRTAFLGAVLRAAHGAEAARAVVVAEVETARLDYDVDETDLWPGDRRRGVLQPDAVLTAAGSHALVELRPPRGGAMGPAVLAKLAALAVRDAAGCVPLVLLVLVRPPPVPVLGAGRLPLAGALEARATEVAERSGVEPAALARPDELIAWITWAELAAVVTHAAAAFTASDDATAGMVARLAGFVDDAVGLHTGRRVPVRDPDRPRHGKVAAADVTNASPFGRLVAELRWELGSLWRYHDGGCGRENVLTAEVMAALEMLPRTFLAGVLAAAHGADAARGRAVADAERTAVSILSEMQLNPTAPARRDKIIVQPDAVLDGPASYVLLEFKRLRSYGFQANQLPRQLLTALVEAGTRPAVVLVVVPEPPPWPVKDVGRMGLPEAAAYGLDTLAAAAPRRGFDAAALAQRIPATMAWITWAELAEVVADTAATYHSGDPSADAAVRRLADTVSTALAVHA